MLRLRSNSTVSTTVMATKVSLVSNTSWYILCLLQLFYLMILFTSQMCLLHDMLFYMMMFSISKLQAGEPCDPVTFFRRTHDPEKKINAKCKEMSVRNNPSLMKHVWYVSIYRLLFTQSWFAQIELQNYAMHCCAHSAKRLSEEKYAAFLYQSFEFLIIG